MNVSTAAEKRRVPALARTGKILLTVLRILFLALLCVIFLFPLEWMVVNSFKSQDVIYSQMDSLLTFLPGTWNVTEWFSSYANLFRAFPFFGRSVLNSFLYCAVTIAGVLLINSFAGYALARYEFPGARLVSTIVILLIIVPVETSIVPLYVILHKLGFLSSRVPVMRVAGYLIPGFVSAMYVYMFRNFFLGMPRELEEAAKIDGANRIKTYFTVIMPLSKPIFATVAIFTFMGAWNEYVFAQLMFTNPAMQPLQVFLQLVNSFNPKDISMVMASLTVSTIPIAIVYVFCQKYIVEGVSFSGLK